VVSIVAAVLLLAVVAWVGWEVYRGPTVTRQLSAGDALPIASNLGTLTVPPGWSGRTTTLRSSPVAWVQFRASTSLSKQVIELRLPDGSADVVLDVTHGPGAYRALLGKAEAESEARGANPNAMEMVQSDSGSGGFGGRKSLALGSVKPVRGVWGSTVTIFVWDPSAPFIMTIRDSRPPSAPSDEASTRLVAVRSFDFAPAAK
jgi:hypothetical protein